MEKLILSIVTPYGSIYEGEVKHVIMPGKEGEFDVFPGHFSLLSLLKTGVIEFEDMQGGKGIIAINWGHAQVSTSPNETDVKIIADGAVAIKGNTETEIAQALNNAKTLIAEASEDTAHAAMVIAHAEYAAKNRI
ncbi:ATP synthase F1 subunit epsilon [Helicobacter marmotae]|uniref:ATP synthase epsilon chain n=1 Tax=Helicobacter marmotae TaxID=152490 RepID=A0A3D8I5X0_9HELI|nr:ATP synthase F1 subunit epsilon [Helicobacter marmotae]RDU60144.1 F0F1 ATP synthase subunit epsilon [Helicobacter marmotae]